MDNWKMVFRTDSPVTADIIRDMLDVNGVNAVVMNKQDSAYKVLGFFEVMVPENEAEKAEELIKANNNPKEEFAEPTDE